MIERYRQFVKLINNQVKRNSVFHNATTIIENATEKTQKKFSNLQNTANEKYTVVIQKFNNQPTVIHDLNAKAQPNVQVPQKIVEWWHWYHQLTGLNAVEAAKHQVIVLQDKLFQCQDDRRTLHKQMTDISYKLQEVYGELIQIKREDPKYVHLTIVENKNLQEQKKVINQIALLEKEERDNFTQLATAIKEYHDSQNINAQKYKYLSILASAVIAIVSLIGSIIYNKKRTVDTRNMIGKAQKMNELLLHKNLSEVFNLQNKMNSFDMKLSQYITNVSKTKVKEGNNSDILKTSIEYTVYPIASAVNYVIRQIYTGGSYIVKSFYK